MTKIEPDPGSTLILGRGYNSLTTEEMATAVDATDVITPVGAGGQNVIYEMRQVENIMRLREQLNISASASFSAGFGSGSARATFFRSIEISNYSFFLLIRVKVSNKTETLRNYALLSAAQEFLSDEGPRKFFEVYGDEFVASQVTGGEFLAVIQFETATSSEKESLSSRVRAEGVAARGTSEFSKELEKFNFSSAKNVYVHRRGGTGALPNADQVGDAALNFPATVMADAGNAVLLQVNTLPYAVTVNRPPGKKPITLDAQRLVLDRLLMQREKGVQLKADYTFALDNPYLFKNPDISTINAGIDKIKRAIITIDTAVSDCLLSKGIECDEPVVEVPEIPLVWHIPLEAGLKVMAHLEGIGDVWDTANKYVGTKGQNRRMEGFLISVEPPIPGLSLEFMAHIEGIGDTPYVTEGNFIGTRGQSRRLEGFAIRLTGPLAKYYDVVYMGHLEGIGDVEQRNGEFCGTKGQNRRCEGLRVSVKRK